MDMKQTALNATAEIAVSIKQINYDAMHAMADEIIRAQKIAIYGVGREGLMMKALAMRLFHLGLNSHVVGDMTTPPLAKGDLLLVSAGPGSFSTVAALVDVASKAGARTACFTANPDGNIPKACDCLLLLPAQTMANDQEGTTSVLPMGSLYEGVQYLAFEILVLLLREKFSMTAEDMRTNHTNLE